MLSSSSALSDPRPASVEPSIQNAEAELDARLRALPTPEASRVQREVERRSLELGLSWERKEGGYDPVPLMLRPRLWTAAQADAVQRDCLSLQRSLGRILELWLEVPSVRPLVPLTPYEEERIRRLLQSGVRPSDSYLFCRLDAVVDFTGDVDSQLHFLEPNVVGVGGTRYTALAEQVWMEVVRPALGDFPVSAQIDSRRLMLDHLVDRARALGVDHSPRFALVEDLRDLYGTNELRMIAEYFTAAGFPAYHVDLRQLTRRGDQLLANGQPVDLVYRFPELRELEEIESSEDLSALWWAFATHRVVSTLGGDFDHKSTFEIFTSPELARLFPAEEQRVFARTVQWTRMLSQRRTTAWSGEAVELAELARTRREALVIKPNRSYGGDRVYIGPEMTSAAWERAIDDALGEPGAWVVQRYTPLPRQSFPVWEGGTWTSADMAMVSGFYATPRGVTSMGRVAPNSVVNLTRKGALVPQIRV